MNSPVCVDANFALKLWLKEEHSDLARAKWEEWTDDRDEIFVPGLFWYEVTAVLRRKAHSGILGDADAALILNRALEFAVTTIASPALHRQALAIATELGLPTAYDSHYLALARQMDCALWTADRRLFTAAAPAGMDVILLGA